jgi:hypothetical protein
MENEISNEDREKADNYINEHIISDLPYIFKLRIAMKHIFSDASHKYYAFLKSIVEHTTGPLCMRVALEQFFAQDSQGGFHNLCKEYYNNQMCSNFSYEQIMGKLFMELYINHPFINEDDASWLPTYSSVEQKYIEYKAQADSAITIQSYIRQRKAKLILSTYEYARENNLYIVFSNNIGMDNITIKKITSGDQAQNTFTEEIQSTLQAFKQADI